MATFKVGQRVRIINQNHISVANYGKVLASEAIITRIGGCFYASSDCAIKPDGDSREWEAPFDYLAPLTDPAADQFIERIKKLGREPVIVPEKVTV